MAAGKKKTDCVRENLIHVETVKKEQRHLTLHTEFSINPFRKLHVLPDKPMSRKLPEALSEDTTYIEAYRWVRMEPSKKYPTPITESQEIGWISSPVERLLSRYVHPSLELQIRAVPAVGTNLARTATTQAAAGGGSREIQDDPRFDFRRRKTDVTEHATSAQWGTN
ncbi:cilia- and flagella-associated protein 144 [Anableps anableps]